MREERLWNYKVKPNNITQQLAQSLGLTTYLAQLLVNRGVRTIEEAKFFLDGDFNQLEDPFILPGLEKAVNRILRAIEQGEKILIYGDYDVDGITSTALLTDFLNKQGANVRYYIPERLGEGYGLNKEALQWAKSTLNCSLVITVDCGISAIEEVEAARSYGLDIIITDHHEPGLDVPQALAVINPKLNPNSCFQHLAGVGVAFKLAQGLALRLKLATSYYESLLDLVALGTIADVVPLIGENRILVKHGLIVLNRLNRPGIKALVEVAGLTGKDLSTSHVAFGLAPRLNAVGRLGNASPAVELLLTASEQLATEIAVRLNRENAERQMVETQIYKEVCERIEKEIDLTKEKVIVLASDVWHSGVIGIVASKIVEKYYRPTVLLAIEGEYAKGSGRSIKDFDLFKALQNCESVLEKYGGHFYAAGLTLKTKNIDHFKTMINNYAENYLSPASLIPSQDVDLTINLCDIDEKLLSELKKLEPFGASNPEPVFYCRKVNIENGREVGKQANHLKCRVKDNNIAFEAIGFNFAHLLEGKNGYLEKEVDILFSLQENVWNGNSYPQLNLKDISTRPLFKELYQINLDLTSFWNNTFERPILIKAPLRKIGNAISFLLEELFALKKLGFVRLDGQLNFQVNNLDSQKAILLTDPFYKKYQNILLKYDRQILDCNQLFTNLPSAENIVDYRGEKKERVLDELIQQGKRLFIICNYREQAEIINSKLLQRNSYLNSNSIKIVFTKEDLYDFIINRQETQIVISNQLLELYSWYDYDLKVFYHPPFSEAELLLRTKQFENKPILLLWDLNDLIYNKDMLQAMFPEADFLDQLVSALRTLNDSKPLIFNDILRVINYPNHKTLNISILAGLKICEELGIVTKQGGALYPNLKGTKINWEESACFQEGLKEKEAYGLFTNSPLAWEEKTEVI